MCDEDDLLNISEETTSDCDLSNTEINDEPATIDSLNKITTTCNPEEYTEDDDSTSEELLCTDETITTTPTTTTSHQIQTTTCNEEEEIEFEITIESSSTSEALCEEISEEQSSTKYNKIITTTCFEDDIRWTTDENDSVSEELPCE